MPRDRSIQTVHVWRLFFLGLAMLGLFGALVFRLWNLQVAQGMEYQRRLAKQSLRSVRLPGVRGRILDLFWPSTQPADPAQLADALTQSREQLSRDGYALDPWSMPE